MNVSYYNDVGGIFAPDRFHHLINGLFQGSKQHYRPIYCSTDKMIQKKIERPILGH